MKEKQRPINIRRLNLMLRDMHQILKFTFIRDKSINIGSILTQKRKRHTVFMALTTSHSDSEIVGFLKMAT